MILDYYDGRWHTPAVEGETGTQTETGSGPEVPSGEAWSRRGRSWPC